MLCAKCLRIFLNFNGTGNHHQSRGDVEKAATNGCRICMVVAKEAALAPSTTRFEYCVWTDILVSISWPSNRLHVPINLKTVGSFKPPTSYAEYVAQSKRDIDQGKPYAVRPDGFSQRDLPGNTGHDDTVRLCLSWLRDCMANHENCDHGALLIDPANKRAQRYLQPKRLVDVTCPDNCLKLVLRDEEAIKEPYATLSHCWGEAEFFTLNKDNYNSATSGGISMNKLPKTFREVISVCRRLGIKYIWIDSLCIIQGPGSEQDWEEHMIEMRQIYSQCILNISASCSRNPEEGIFRDRDPRALEPVYVPCITNFRSIVGDYSNPKWAVISFEEDRLSHLRDDSLVSRGWVVQERFLSPRILYFGHDRIYLQCTQLSISEAYQHFPTELWDSVSDKEEKIGFRGSDILRSSFYITPSLLAMDRSDAQYTMECTREWLRFVEIYTTKKLSFPDKDKLAAIEGVTRQFAALIPSSEYTQGIFTYNLPLGLLWSVLFDGKLPMSTGRAPSWSWRNTNSEVWFIFGNDTWIKPECQLSWVEDMRIDRESHELQLRGSIQDIWDLRRSLAKDDGTMIDLMLDNEPRLPRQHLQGTWNLSLNGKECVVLPVYACRTGTSRGQIAGLVLLEDDVQRQYRRVGTYMVFVDQIDPWSCRPTELLDITII